MKAFCERLKEVRKSKKLTQMQLAQKIQTNNSSICDWERGRSQPDLETLTRLALFFEVTTDFLLGLEDETGTRILNLMEN